MPAVSRLMIRLSLIYLLLGLILGTLMLINKAHFIHPAMWFVLPAHIEWMIFGWIIQFTLGTAYWILPRILETKGRGPIWPAWLMAVSLNVGILFVTAGGFIGSSYVLTGRIFEILAVLLFVMLHWKRVVTYANHSH